MNLEDRKYGTVIIDSDPRGASIYVDGQILINPDTEESIKTPAKVIMTEGRKDIVIRMNGYDDYLTYVDVIQGALVSKYGSLKPYSGKQISPLQETKVNNQETKVNNQETKVNNQETKVNNQETKVDKNIKVKRLDHKIFGFYEG